MSDATESAKRAYIELMNRELAAADAFLDRRDAELATGLYMHTYPTREPVNAKFDLPKEHEVVFERPPIEDYVRTTLELDGFTYEPAVEWRSTDDYHDFFGALGFDGIVEHLEGLVHVSKAFWHEAPKNVAHPMNRAKDIGARIAAAFPGRAYFVEVWQNGRKGFAQVFQPFGVPKNR